MISSKKWFSVRNPLPLFNFLKIERRLTTRKEMLYRSAALGLLGNNINSLNKTDKTDKNNKKGKNDIELIMAKRLQAVVDTVTRAYQRIAEGEEKIDLLTKIRSDLLPSTVRVDFIHSIFLSRKIEQLTTTDDNLHAFQMMIVEEYSNRFPQFGTKYIRINELLTNIIRDLFQNVESTFDEAWKTTSLIDLAEGMLKTGDFSSVWALADLLEESGCENSEILNHCRDTKIVHNPGCWVVDLILGKK